MLALLLALLMPIRTGTPSQVDASAGNGSTSVTVPAAANCVVAFWSHWDSNGGTTLSALTLNGVGFTIASQLAEGAVADESGVGVARLLSPATGPQTLAWTWSAGAARTEGGEIVLVYIQDANLADPQRAAATDANISTNNVAVTLATETTDLLLAFAAALTAGPVLDGTVFINNATLNSQFYDVSEVTPAATSTTVNMTGENFSAMAAISLKTAVGAGDDVVIRFGPFDGTSGSGLVMAAFAASAVVTVGGGAYFLRRRKLEAIHADDL